MYVLHGSDSLLSLFVKCFDELSFFYITFTTFLKIDLFNVLKNKLSFQHFFLHLCPEAVDAATAGTADNIS